MVEVKANADNSRGGCEVSVSIEGHGQEILEEVLAVVQGVMGSLKDESVPLHMLAIKAIADNPEILTGEEHIAKEFEKFVATTSFKKGVN